MARCLLGAGWHLVNGWLCTEISGRHRFSVSLLGVLLIPGDFDGDGNRDILWQFADTSRYSVWFMNGTQLAAIGDFTLPSYAGKICCVADSDE